jgi:OmpA-OmpF porin, OOP family
MFKNRVAWPVLVAAAGAALAGCVNFSNLDDLKTAQPTGGPFDRALYQDYAFLAHTFGDVGQASYTSFDQDASISLARTNSDIAALANTYAGKALQISRGEAVDPEPSRDVKSHELRDRLIRALTTGSDQFPRDAARAQADWDCWRLNLTVSSQASAAEACRRSFEVTLPRLEAEAQAVAAAQAAQKKAQPQAAATSDTGTAPSPETP